MVQIIQILNNYFPKCTKKYGNNVALGQTKRKIGVHKTTACGGPEKKTQHKMSGAKRGEHSPANLAEELKKKNKKKRGPSGDFPGRRPIGDSGDTVSSAYTQLDMVKLAHRNCLGVSPTVMTSICTTPWSSGAESSGRVGGGAANANWNYSSKLAKMNRIRRLPDKVNRRWSVAITGRQSPGVEPSGCRW